MEKRSWMLVLALCATCLLSCEDPGGKLLEEPVTASDSVKTESVKSEKAVLYTIDAGHHECDQSTFATKSADTLKFSVKFDSTAIYQTKDARNQGDINKLYGLSDCGTLHQENSARFGWRWYNNKLEIWGYTYNSSARSYALVGSVDIGTFNEYEIIFADTKYIFKLNDRQIELPRHCSGKAQGYKLFPYFGGDETAPHDIKIWMADL